MPSPTSFLAPSSNFIIVFPMRVEVASHARSFARSFAWREINRRESYIACCGAGRHTRNGQRIHGDAWCAANTGKRHFSTPWRNQLIDPHSFRPWPLSFFRPADGAGNFAPRQGDTTPLKNVSRTCVCVWRLGSWMSEWIFEKMLLPLANRSFHGRAMVNCVVALRASSFSPSPPSSFFLLFFSPLPRSASMLVKTRTRIFWCAYNVFARRCRGIFIIFERIVKTKKRFYLFIEDNNVECV